MAAQFTSTHGLLQRSEWLWMERAIISLPVPVSPTINTAAGWHATCSTSRITRFKASLRMIWLVNSHGLLTAVDRILLLIYTRKRAGSAHLSLVIAHDETTSSHSQLKKRVG